MRVLLVEDDAIVARSIEVMLVGQGFTVIATDLDPGALPAGLTRDELWEKLKGHAKGVAGIVGLFKR